MNDTWTDDDAAHAWRELTARVGLPETATPAEYEAAFWRDIFNALGLPEQTTPSLFAIQVAGRHPKPVDGIGALWAWKQYRESGLSDRYAEDMGRERENRPIPPEIVALLDYAAVYLDALEASGESPGTLGPNEHVARMFGFDEKPHPLMDNYRNSRKIPIIRAFLANDCNVVRTARALGIGREQVRQVTRGTNVEATRQALRKL